MEAASDELAKYTVLVKGSRKQGRRQAIAWKISFDQGPSELTEDGDLAKMGAYGTQSSYFVEVVCVARELTHVDSQGS